MLERKDAKIMEMEKSALSVGEMKIIIIYNHMYISYGYTIQWLRNVVSLPVVQCSVCFVHNKAI